MIEFVQAMPVVRTFDSGSTGFSLSTRLKSWSMYRTRYRKAGFSAFSFSILNSSTLMS